MYYVGADLHKEQTWFYIMDHNGTKIDSKSIANSPDSLKSYFAAIPTPFTLAVEAAYNWYFFIDLAEQFAEKVFLANSYELKVLNKEDALHNLLIGNKLPINYFSSRPAIPRHKYSSL